MSKKEIIKSDSIDPRIIIIGEIEKDLKDIQDGKVKGITLTLGLIDKYYRLYKADGLSLNAFLVDSVINSNSIKNIDWINLPTSTTHNDRLRAFNNLVLIPALKTSVDDMKKNDPFKFETLRDISESVLASLINDFICYDVNGNCFTDAVGNQPKKIRVYASKLNLLSNSIDAKKRYNPDDNKPNFNLSFEKLKSFTSELLTGRPARVINLDPTISTVAKKIDNLKKEISSNVALKEVNLKATPTVIQLEKTIRKNEVLELFRLCTSTIDKLAVNSEFDTIRKIAVYISTHKAFNENQKKYFDSEFCAMRKFGNQLEKIDLKDLDLITSTDKLIETTLKKKVVK